MKLCERRKMQFSRRTSVNSDQGTGDY